MTTSGAEHESPAAPGTTRQRLALDEQARRKGTRPIGDGSFYAREGIWDSEEELHAFLRHVRTTR
jgi:hypothetical protein